MCKRWQFREGLFDVDNVQPRKIATPLAPTAQPPLQTDRAIDGGGSDCEDEAVGLSTNVIG
jgi:hypothetical protein